MSKARISNKVKWASALLTMRHAVDGKLVPIFTHAEARKLTADQIISRFDHHHYPIPEAHGGPSEPWNITPMLRAEHRRITAKVTIPAIAKAKRLRADQDAFKRRLLAKSGQVPVDVTGGMDGGRPPEKHKRAWPSRPFPGSKKDKAARAKRNAR